MKMVMILLQFIRAERTGDWHSWPCCRDHTNYTRWGVVYADDISQLETSHPDVYEKFMERDFVVKSSRNTFNQISTALALEHVNKVEKVVGGLIGITRSDSARDRWCLTYNERSRIVDQTADVLGMTLEDDEYSPSASGDAGLSRIKGTEKMSRSYRTWIRHRQRKSKSLFDTRLCRQKVGFHDTLKQSQSPTLTKMYMVESKKSASQKKTNHKI